MKIAACRHSHHTALPNSEQTVGPVLMHNHLNADRIRSKVSNVIDSYL